MSMNKAKKRSRELVIKRLGNYLKKDGIKLPPSHVLRKMNCEEIIAWGDKRLKPSKVLSAR
jgi:hypothetical protein